MGNNKFTGVSLNPLDIEIFHWIDEIFTPYREIFPEWEEGYTEVSNFCDNFSFEIKVEGSHIDFNVHPPIKVPEELVGRFKEIYEGCFDDYFKLDKFLGAKSISLDKEIQNEIKSRESSIVYSGGKIFREELKFRMGISFLGELKWELV